MIVTRMFFSALHDQQTKKLMLSLAIRLFFVQWAPRPQLALICMRFRVRGSHCAIYTALTETCQSFAAGTSRDVSYLIDFLPSYLFPTVQAQITEWLMGGISLGGHATWLALRHGAYHT